MRGPQDTPRPTTTVVDEPSAGAATPRGVDGSPVAVVVCHGMGQQVPFETLECLAQSLRMASGDPKREVRTEVVRLAQMPSKTSPRPPEPVDLRRAEIDLPAGRGGQRVHLYEAYWAPITEGQVGLRDVFWFLLTAGVLGFVRWFQSRRFDRWMFGRWVEFDVPMRTPAKLLGIVLIIASLAVINGVLAAVVSARLLGQARQWPGPELFRALSSDIAIASLGLVAVVLGVALVPRVLKVLGHVAASYGAWTTILAGLAAILTGGALCVVHIAASQFGRIPPGGWLGDDLERLRGLRYVLLVGFVWVPPVLAALVVRRFMVEYVGDVVAYISSHSVNKFNEMRKAIHKVSSDVAGAVYRAVGEDGQPLYARVVVVGHSLGSVVAYDTLNSLLIQDRLDGESAGVQRRTAMLLTFGSPLNKTAYIFRNQRAKGSEVRETMAAAIQPLISSPDNRTMPWVNIYSRNDWIGGKLDFYDLNPPDPKWMVDNKEDEDARTPLAAHGEHWSNPMLSEVLKLAIVGAPRSTSAGIVGVIP